MPEMTMNDNPVDAPSPTSDMSSPTASQNTPKRKREPSPPHVETLADNEDVAVSNLARPARTQQRDLFPNPRFGDALIANTRFLI